MAQAIFQPHSSRAGVDAQLEALRKLEALTGQAGHERARDKSNQLLKRAVRTWHKGNITKAGQWALKALEVDGENPKALHLLAMTLERMGHLHKALVTYERAFQIDPNDPELLINLGLIAWNLKLTDNAVKLFKRYIDACPDSPLGYNNLGSVQAEMGHPDLAVETLRGALYRMPEHAILWNALGTVLAEQGRADESLVFYTEAARLEPSFARIYHNMGYAMQHLSRMPDAVQLYDKALNLVSDPAERIEIKHSRSISLIGSGVLEKGFREYEIRNDPHFRAYSHHLVEAEFWNGQNPNGKKLLLVAEQGLGDEIMFANILPDALNAVGKDGRLQIGVDPRLVPLVQRSFPNAEVGAYEDRTLNGGDGRKSARIIPFACGDNKPDFWAPMGSALQFYRKSLTDFPHKTYFVPDAEQIDKFRYILSSLPGRKVGICWRSMMTSEKRAKYYAPIDRWAPILKTSGISFINLQYGDCQSEIAHVRQNLGITIHEIEGLDLKQDIDGTAGLAAALDFVISAPTAAAHTAASVGAPVWFISAAQGWPQMGTDEYPWYPNTKAFWQEKCTDWDSVISQVAHALAL